MFLVVLFASVVGEQALFALNSTASAGTHSKPPTTLRGKVHAALVNALGPSDRGVRRFQLLSIQTDSANRGKVVTVRWSINNDLSTGSIPNGAQADAYLIFADLFQVRAPIRRVNLIGTYPHGTSHDTPVMRLWLDRKTAYQVGSYGWGTIDAQTLWPLIHRTYIAPDFEPTPTE